MSVVLYTQVLLRGCSMNIHKKVMVATVQGKGIPKKSRSYNYFHVFFDAIERLVGIIGYHSRGHGKHRRILETDIQCV